MGSEVLKSPFLPDPDVCGPSSLEGDNISYLGILSSTSTGHQPKISHVFTVSLKGTHLPVRIPVGRQEPLGSHPILGFYLMVDESQDENWVDSFSGEQLGGAREREAGTSKVAAEVTGLTLSFPFCFSWSAAIVILAYATFWVLGDGRAAGPRPSPTPQGHSVDMEQNLIFYKRPLLTASSHIYPTSLPSGQVPVSTDRGVEIGMEESSAQQWHCQCLRVILYDSLSNITS